MIVYALLGGMYCSPLFAKNEFMNIFTKHIKHLILLRTFSNLKSPENISKNIFN